MIMLEPSIAAAIAWKTSLLLAVIGLIATLAARQSAARRHFLWTCALAFSLSMPIAVISVPTYVHLTLPWGAADRWARDVPAFVTAPAREAGAVSEVHSQRPIEFASAARPTRSIWRTAMTVWLVGALLVMLRNALAHVGLIRWVRKARPDLSPAWAATLSSVATGAALRRPLRVLESDHTTSPCTFGLMRPVILLPAAGAYWPEAQRRFTLLHELAHVRRLDYFTTQLASLACAVHWYDPLVWFAAAQARKLQEQACDDVVLNDGGTPSDYAQFLVGIAGGGRHLLPAAIGMVQRSQLHGRVTAILDASKTRLPLSRLTFVAALTPLACLTFLLATLSATAAPVSIQPGVPVTASFNSVELRNGGTVTLIHGASQTVTLIEGDPETSSIAVRDDGRLVIDRCPTECPGRHKFNVEVVTPTLANITVAEGGTIQTRGDFPHQMHIGLAVRQGGTIDLRPLALANITASVYSGGRIFIKPQSALSATVEQGGIITYWGDAVVESSVEHGGVVTKGSAADVDRPLAEFGPQPVPPLPAIPALPSIPAIEPIRS